MVDKREHLDMRRLQNRVRIWVSQRLICGLYYTLLECCNTVQICKCTEQYLHATLCAPMVVQYSVVPIVGILVVRASCATTHTTATICW